MQMMKAVEFLIIVLFLLSCGLAGLFYIIGHYTRRLRVWNERSRTYKKT